MNMDWNESTLWSLRIHELRDLARKIGVKCPTALKKNDLVEQSMSILRGDSKPYKALNKKGRPTKNRGNFNGVSSSSFLPNEEDFRSAIALNEGEDFNFEVNMSQIEYNAELSEQIEGLVEISENGVGIVRVKNYETSEEDVFIHESFIKQHNIVSGDFIKAYVRVIIFGRPRAVVKVISVNEGCDFSAEKETNLEVLNKIVKPAELVLVLQNEYSTTKLATEIFEKLFNGVNIYASAYEKVKHENTQNKIFACVDSFKTYKDVFCCYNMAIYRAIVLSKKTQVTLVINSLTAFYRSIESILCGQIENPSKLAIAVKEYILKMFKKAMQNNVTLIVVDSPFVENKIKEFLQFELPPIADHVIEK